MREVSIKRHAAASIEMGGGVFYQKMSARLKAGKPFELMAVLQLEQESVNMQATFCRMHPKILLVKCRPVCRWFVSWRLLFGDDSA